MNIIQRVLSVLFLPFKRFALNGRIKKLKTAIENQALDNILELLLYGMKLLFAVNPAFRKNIHTFNARYCFKSRDGTIAAAAIFKNSQMTVKHTAIPDSTVTVVFDNGKTLWNFLCSGDPNVFDYILESKLSFTGNLNYLLKFGYMVKYIQLQFGL